MAIRTGTHDTNMMTTVTMSADKMVLACCPDPPPASQILSVVGLSVGTRLFLQDAAMLRMDFRTDQGTAS